MTNGEGFYIRLFSGDIDIDRYSIDSAYQLPRLLGILLSAQVNPSHRLGRVRWGTNGNVSSMPEFTSNYYVAFFFRDCVRNPLI